MVHVYYIAGYILLMAIGIYALRWVAIEIGSHMALTTLRAVVQAYPAPKRPELIQQLMARTAANNKIPAGTRKLIVANLTTLMAELPATFTERLTEAMVEAATGMGQGLKTPELP